MSAQGKPKEVIKQHNSCTGPAQGTADDKQDGPYTHQRARGSTTPVLRRHNKYVEVTVAVCVGPPGRDADTDHACGAIHTCTDGGVGETVMPQASALSESRQQPGRACGQTCTTCSDDVQQ